MWYKNHMPSPVNGRAAFAWYAAAIAVLFALSFVSHLAMVAIGVTAAVVLFLVLPGWEMYTEAQRRKR